VFISEIISTVVAKCVAKLLRFIINCIRAQNDEYQSKRNDCLEGWRGNNTMSDKRHIIKNKSWNSAGIEIQNKMRVAMQTSANWATDQRWLSVGNLLRSKWRFVEKSNELPREMLDEDGGSSEASMAGNLVGASGLLQALNIWEAGSVVHLIESPA
jgi:hypothetical protein